MFDFKLKSPKVFAILNITPDSFSDGGKYLNVDDAINYAEKLIEEGAEIIDIGAESTRPFAANVDMNEEIHRLQDVIPELYKLTSSSGVKLSLDSRNFDTINHLIKYIDIVNDVEGLSDERISDLVIETGKEVVMMHSLSVPANPNITIPLHENPVDYLKNWLRVKMKSLEMRGMDINKLIFDPGIGFSKNAKQSLYLLKNINEFQDLGCKTLVGHSRKSLFRYFEVASSMDELDFYTALISMYMTNVGVDYIRIHNVGMTKRMIRNISTFYGIESYQDELV